MIGRIQGELIHVDPPHLLVDVNGVGYEIEAPTRVFNELPMKNQPVTLVIHHLVREDAQILYGFTTLAERGLFRNLLKVNGVGAKSALAILSVMTASEFAGEIQAQNVQALVAVPGIGKKTAQRLLIEMKDKVGFEGGAAGGAPRPAVAANMTAQQQAESALMSLGYKPQQAAQMVKSVATDGMPVEEIIRLSLQNKGNK